MLRGHRFKHYSTGEFYDLSEDPLEKHDLAETLALNKQATTGAYDRLKRELHSLPPNAKLPWEFRSISARKIRKQEAERKKHELTEHGSPNSSQ